MHFRGPTAPMRIVKKKLSPRKFNKDNRIDSSPKTPLPPAKPDVLPANAKLIKGHRGAGVAPVPPVGQAAEQWGKTAASKPVTVQLADDVVVKGGADANRLATTIGQHLAKARAPGDDPTIAGARTTILSMLYGELGEPGSMLDHPTGLSFRLRGTPGEVFGRKSIPVPLPEGEATHHLADVVIETGGRRLVLDVLTSHGGLNAAKAASYDALMLRGGGTFGVLVFVRGPGLGLTQEQIEAVGHPYRHTFSLNDEHSREEGRYAALRARLVEWVRTGK